MPKISKNLSFKNCEIRVNQDEINGEKKIWILEYTKDEEIITDFDSVLEMFAGEEGINISFKVEKGMED